MALQTPLLSGPVCRARCQGHPFRSLRPAAARTVLAQAASSGAHRSEQDSAAVQSIPCQRRHMLAALCASAACIGGLPSAASAAYQPATSLGPAEGTARVITTLEAEGMTSQEKLVLNINRRVQLQNRVPLEFPGFVREGFDVKVVADGYLTAPSGLIYRDFEEGRGLLPVDGQEVVFNYTGYNESGSVIDTSFKQGRPAQTRLGVNGMIPGFEEGIRGMKAGGVRRFIVPPALGPPVGPSTFFSAKQCEVFDVELLDVRTCTRRQVMMFSDVVCE